MGFPTLLRSSRSLRWMVCLLLACAGLPAFSQESRQPWDEYEKRIKAAEEVAAMGDDLFGDAVNLQNGALSFSQTDVSIPGNSALPVAFRRVLSIQNRKGYQYNDAPLGDWDLDIPRISGVFKYGGTGFGSTCTATTATAGRPPAVTVSGGVFASQEYWSGNTADMPGGGELLLVGAGSPKPSTGGPYYWMTSGFTYFSCLSSIKNGTGQGFLAITSDGTKYWFDWLAQYREPDMDKVVASASENSATGPWTATATMPRSRKVLYVTRVEDRFGNWVTYTYANAANAPVRLTRIDANDGRAITVGYNGGQVETVGNGTHTWTYRYTYPSAEKPSLSAVILPDGSRWTLNLATLSSTAIRYIKGAPGDPNRDCRDPGDVSTPGASGTITHPSGAVGEFTVEPTRHGRSNVPMVCSGYTSPYNAVSDDVAVYPLNYDSLSLVNKRISGPGLTPAQWNYAYGADIYFSPGTGPICYSGSCMAPTCTADSCAGTSKTYVWGPDNKFIRYTYGNSYRYNEGKLLKVETGTGTPLSMTAPPTILKTETSAYQLGQSGQPFQTPIGTSIQEMGRGFSSEYPRPQHGTTISQDGANFNSQVDGFDAFARATSTRKWSSIWSAVRTEVPTYYDDWGRWVLGQTAKLTVNNVVVNETSFDGSSNPAVLKSFGRVVQSLTYNADGTIATAKDGKDNKTTLGGWKRGIPQNVLYADSTTQSATVNNLGWVTSATDENGYATGYGYDAMGRLSSVVYPSGDSTAWNARTRVFSQVGASEYGIPAGHWKLDENTGYHKKVTYFDALWRPVFSEDVDMTNIPATARQTITRYDANGQVVFQSYPRNPYVDGWVNFDMAMPGTDTIYDALGRVTSVSQPWEQGTATTITQYLPGFQVRVKNPRVLTTTTGFHALDRPSYDQPMWTVKPEGQTIESFRDVFGRLVSLRQFGTSAGVWSDVTRRYVYDGEGQLCKQIEPETGATVMGYDDAGNLEWTATGLALPATDNCNALEALNSDKDVWRSYDTRNRLTTLRFPDGRGDQDWVYTPDGLPSQITTWNAAWGFKKPAVNAYTYNKRRLLTGESLAEPTYFTWGIGYGYNGNGDLATQTYPSGLVIDYAPNALGQATKAGTPAGNAVFASNVTYYPNGAIKHFTYGNGLERWVVQNPQKTVQQIVDAGGVMNDIYSYDPNGNVSAIVDELPGAGVYSPRSRWMSYDGLDRLKDAGSGSFGGDNWYHFTYDTLDNMRSWKLSGGKDHASYVYDASNRLTNIRNSAGATTVGLGYDPQGNLSNKNGQAYTFDYGNRLRDVPGKEYYGYDAHGRRFQAWRPNNTQTLSMFSNAGQVMYQENSSTSLATDNIYLGGQLLVIRERNTATNAYATKYQHTDALGSPVAVTNDAASVIERTQYEPFGAAIGKTVNGIGYTGHLMDAATSLTYMQQRYYDPQIGRFLSVDPVAARPIGDNFNRYW